MLQEVYRGYLISSHPVESAKGKWSVSVIIEKAAGGIKRTETFYAHDNIHYILEIEAAKESINLGKNLIRSNSVGF